ncbi:sulfurtransferase [Coralloluteibacterium stylophorae]|uniref:Sulfurtransferase n=1 Tax=Coralloluteibacterium stylophorae TaxID=1776034 RepID=A0A8J7VYL9_9GAMM|nr:sulfurtransferase [Coralloluteibacterium stylophorae]MBS7458911.1 sulfurtransferase [Coralloluteibacterium stylophorae]
MANDVMIDAETLAGRLGAAGLVVLDCRFDLADSGAGERLWREARIPGARHAHLERDLSGAHAPGAGRHPLPEPRDLAARLAAWGIDAGSEVVVYDAADGAMAAARAWWLLRWLGRRGVRVLDGGFRRWLALGLPVERGEPAPVAAAAAPAPHADVAMRVDAQELLARLGEPPGWLLDARAAPRFAGRAEPIDPVAGHVPGAVNRPYTDNLDADGRMKQPAQLAREFAALLAGRAPEEVVAMCGSGVTACHTLLAMAHAGLDGARLYPGSWSGWIEDPRRPVVRAD